MVMANRLSHLNFGTINDLTKHELVYGLPKFKYGKYYLCSAYERGKSKKSSHPSSGSEYSFSKVGMLQWITWDQCRLASFIGRNVYFMTVDALFHDSHGGMWDRRENVIVSLVVKWLGIEADASKSLIFLRMHSARLYGMTLQLSNRDSPFMTEIRVSLLWVYASLVLSPAYNLEDLPRGKVSLQK
ncbi:hypothetical protein Tco_0953503 [Tanacetum coccineum]|uniref:Uncharacterized protein n=1 Tax=Tanacetum coccineum TaxID=301880 RepID=A0ABQ5E2V2_9ASTR